MAHRRFPFTLASSLLGLAAVLAGCGSSSNGAAPPSLLDEPAPVSVTRSLVVQKDRTGTLDLTTGLRGFVSARVRADGRMGSFRLEGGKAIYTPKPGSEGVDHGTILVDQGGGNGVDVEVYADVRPCLRVPADLRPAAGVHVIGVYESASNDLDAKEANRRGTIDVTVAKTDEPVTLVLSSSEGVGWKVHLEEGANLAKVVLSSYYADDVSVSGLPAGTTVEKDNLGAYGYGWEPAANTGGSSFRRMMAKVREKLGGTETSFQGQYGGRSFRVPFEAASLASAPTDPPISHYSFADQRCDDACASSAPQADSVWATPASGPFDSYAIEQDGLTARALAGNFNASVRSARGARCGKHYFELALTPATSTESRSPSVGVLTSLGSDPYPQLLLAPSIVDQAYLNVAVDRVGVALDLDRGVVFYRDANGWHAPGFGGPGIEPDRAFVDPVTGAKGALLDLWTYDDVLVGADIGAGATVRFVDRDFAFTPPEGFTPGL